MKNLTVIMSLHELDMAKRVSDHILCIDGRYVDRYGTPGEVFTDQYVSGLFGITAGSFDETGEDLELEKPDGRARIFVIAGGGLGRKSFSIKSIHFKKNVVNPMLNLSFPVIVEKVAFALGKTVVNSMSKEYGSVTVGALGISNNINGITTQCQNGFQDGGASIISQNIGAGNLKRALDTFWRLLIINAGIGLIGYILLNVFIEPITWLFANSQEGFNAEFQQTIIKVFRYDSFGGCVPLGINAAVMASAKATSKLNDNLKTVIVIISLALSVVCLIIAIVSVGKLHNFRNISC